MKPKLNGGETRTKGNRIECQNKDPHNNINLTISLLGYLSVSILQYNWMRGFLKLLIFYQYPHCLYLHIRDRLSVSAGYIVMPPNKVLKSF